MTIESRLAEIRARVDAATEGPWKFEQGGHSSCGEPACCSEDWDNRIWANGTVLLEDYQLTGTNAEFIAASRTDLPALLAAVEAVLDLHAADEDGDCAECIRRAQGRGDQSYPCPTIIALTAALEADATTREDQS